LCFVHRRLTVVEVNVTTKYDKLEVICFDLLCAKVKLRFPLLTARPPHNNMDAVHYLEYKLRA